MNPHIIPTRGPEAICDMPYLQSTFSNEHVTLDELHSDISGRNYQNQGYATMMLASLIKIALEANCTSLGGHLSWVDAPSEKEKESRNSFYQNKGFTLQFDDDSKKNGSIHLNLSSQVLKNFKPYNS